MHRVYTSRDSNHRHCSKLRRSDPSRANFCFILWSNQLLMKFFDPICHPNPNHCYKIDSSGSKDNQKVWNRSKSIENVIFLNKKSKNYEKKKFNVYLNFYAFCKWLTWPKHDLILKDIHYLKKSKIVLSQMSIWSLKQAKMWSVQQA